MKSYLTLAFALTTSLTFVSCSSVPLEVRAPHVDLLRPAASERLILAKGRELYIAGACVKCHEPENLRKLAAEDLRDEILPLMCKKARSTEEEKKALLAYCLKACDAPITQPN